MYVFSIINLVYHYHQLYLHSNLIDHSFPAVAVDMPPAVAVDMLPAVAVDMPPTMAVLEDMSADIASHIYPSTMHLFFSAHLFSR